MTPTPETDHLERNLGNAAHPVLSSFCRKLERERDILRRWTTVNGVIELERERDEARETIAATLRAWQTSQEIVLAVTKELAEARGQRDRLAELHNKNADHFNELLELCGTLRKERNRLAKALQNVINEDGTPISIDQAEVAIKSLTTNPESIHGEKGSKNEEK